MSGDYIGPASWPEPSPPRLRSIEQTCQRLGGISKPTLYALINEQQLRTVRIGRRRFIPDSEIETFITNNLRHEDGDTP